jgi:UPF0271 protein
VLHDAGVVVTQALSIAVNGETTAADGTWVSVTAASLCLHGDTPGAAALGVRVRAALAEAGVVVKAFA